MVRKIIKVKDFYPRGKYSAWDVKSHGNVGDTFFCGCNKPIEITIDLLEGIPHECECGDIATTGFGISGIYRY